jgi:hypothetical protein
VVSLQEFPKAEVGEKPNGRIVISGFSASNKRIRMTNGFRPVMFLHRLGRKLLGQY